MQFYNLDHDPRYSLIPDRIMGALIDWGKEGRPPGGFVTAVLCGDLKAVSLADAETYTHLRAIIAFVHNQMPHRCHGSAEKMAAWQKEKDEEHLTAEERKERGAARRRELIYGENARGEEGCGWSA